MIQLPVYAGSKGKPEMGNFEVLTVQQVREMAGIFQPSHLWFVSIRGDARQCKVNGAIRTWKRDPNRVEVPMKYGFYEYGTFTTADIEAGRLLVRLGD